MKKLLLFALFSCVCSMILAFRLKTSSDRNTAATKRYELLKKQYSISCFGGIKLNDDDPQIGPLTGWGDYRWEITTANDSVQFYFDQGINMYYAYHIVESMASFKKAISLDSTCAMAWYGKGLAVGYSIDLAHDKEIPEEAIEATQKSMEYAGHCSAFEKRLIAAQAARFIGDTLGGIVGMMERYENEMSLVARDHAKNPDALTLYADALTRRYQNLLYEKDLTPKPWTNPIRDNLLAAIALSPRHPGAHHMLIHTLQGSAHPEQALHSADILPSLMPGMAHMVHMPSHIYLRTGFYDKGIAANDDAITAYGVTTKEFAPVLENKLFYASHATHVKANCAMMSGNYAAAKVATDLLLTEVTPELRTIPNVFGNYMQYGYHTKLLVEVRFGKWQNILKDTTNDTLPYGAILYHFARGVAETRLHHVAAAEKELRSLESSLANPLLKDFTNQIDAFYEPATVARDILTGIVAAEKKQYKEAIAAFDRANATDDSLSYGEPRYWILPARHYLGDVYLQMKDYKNAVRVFNEDLVLNPGNVWGYNGLLLAYTATNNTKGVADIKKKMIRANVKTDLVKAVF